MSVCVLRARASVYATSADVLPCHPVGSHCGSSDGRDTVNHQWRGGPTQLHPTNRLVGQVVKASASRTEDPGFESHLRRIFSGSSHTSELKIGTPLATLPGAWRYRVNAGTGRPGVSIL